MSGMTLDKKKKKKRKEAKCLQLQTVRPLRQKHCLKNEEEDEHYFHMIHST